MGGSQKQATAEEEIANEGKSLEWYEKEKDVRVFEGLKYPLTGSTCPSNETPTITFEAYFYPDWAPGLRLKGTAKEDSKDEEWQAKRHEWDEYNKSFHKYYLDAFPDSIGAKNCHRQ